MAIHVISQSATVPLEPNGQVPVPLSAPACELKGLDISIREKPDNATGLWECTPGKFQRLIEQGEVMHILTGRGCFTSETGESIQFRQGDSLFFAPMTRGVWHIEETVRKLYVLL